MLRQKKSAANYFVVQHSIEIINNTSLYCVEYVLYVLESSLHTLQTARVNRSHRHPGLQTY